MVEKTEGFWGEGGSVVVDVEEGEEGRSREIIDRCENLMCSVSVNLCWIQVTKHTQLWYRISYGMGWSTKLNLLYENTTSLEISDTLSADQDWATNTSISRSVFLARTSLLCHCSTFLIFTCPHHLPKDRASLKILSTVSTYTSFCHLAHRSPNRSIPPFHCLRYAFSRSSFWKFLS